MRMTTIKKEQNLKLKIKREIQTIWKIFGYMIGYNAIYDVHFYIYKSVLNVKYFFISMS